MTVKPDCAAPAPLIGKYVGESGYFVAFKGVSGERRAMAERLASKYMFLYQSYVWDDFIFVATLTPGVVANLRCEPDVKNVEYNGLTVIAALRDLQTPNLCWNGP
jgi:hypothetical protein